MVATRKVEDRLYDYHKVSQKKMSQKVAKLHHDECPFRPKVNSAGVHRQGNVWENLYNGSQAREEHLAKKKLNFSQIDEKELTFRPQMVARRQSSRVSGRRHFESLYLDSRRLRESKLAKSIKYDQEYTYKPEIDENSKKIEATPFSVLSQPRPIVQQERGIVEYDEKDPECTFHPKLVNTSYKIPPERLYTTAAGTNFNEPFNRLWTDAKRHNKRRQKCIKDQNKPTKDCTFHPKITSSSHKSEIPDCFKRLSQQHYKTVTLRVKSGEDKSGSNKKGDKEKVKARKDSSDSDSSKDKKLHEDDDSSN